MFGCYRRNLDPASGSANRTGVRMDLLIAVAQRATVVDAGADAKDNRRRQGPRQERSINADALQERAAIGTKLSAEGIDVTEGTRRREAIRIGLLEHRDARIPSLEDIDVRRIDATFRMAAARLAAILDIDAEHNPVFGLAGAIIGRGLDRANARED